MNDERYEKLFLEIEKLLSQDKMDEALKVVDAGMLVLGRLPGLLSERAHINLLLENVEAGIADISEAIERLESEIDYYYARGRYYFKLRMFAPGAKDFTKALELCASQGKTYYENGSLFFRAECYLMLRDAAKARRDPEQLPDDYGTWTDGMRFKKQLLAELESINPQL